jgi:hypothetical protein
MGLALALAPSNSSNNTTITSNIRKMNISSHLGQQNHTTGHPNVTVQDPRPRLLMISSSNVPSRYRIYKTVIHRFAKEGIKVQNTYEGDHGYAKELRRSKFILSPSGIGMDCYRHWEAMIMGTIPVIEHLNRTETDGWFRTLEYLPVALIDSYDNLTPQWLEKEYKRIVSRPHSFYKFEKLTNQWWIDLIQSSVQHGYHQGMH